MESSSFDSVTLCLSGRGDSFSLTKMDGETYRPVDIEKDHIYPKLKEAADLKTHFAVLQFLKSLKNDQECLNTVYLFHTHNLRYPEHREPTKLQKGKAHGCGIENMIDFVIGQIRISNLQSLEEIESYLDDNNPEIEVNFFGTRIVKFKNYSIELDKLIEMVNEKADVASFNIGTGYRVAEKILTYSESSDDKSQQKNVFTKFLTGRDAKGHQDLLDGMKKKLRYK